MPLSFDLPLDELKNYQGINPCPEDFDQFWDDSIAEMQAIDSEVSKTPASFQTPFAKCSNLYFTGVGGSRVHVKLLEPAEQSKPHPAIVMFHGYSMNSGDWIDMLGYVAMGYTVAAMDCRGQGGLSEDRGGVSGNTLSGHIIRGIDGPAESMLFRQIFLDTAQLAKIVMDMPHVDEKRVGALGKSQGGALTLVCAALEPRIKIAAPVYPFLSDYRRIWEMDLAEDAYKELKDYFRFYDPTHEREDEIFEKLGYIDIQNLSKRIKAKVCMATSLMDKICPPSTQFAAYNKITSEKSMVLYPDYSHEHLPGWNDRTLQLMMDL